MNNTDQQHSIGLKIKEREVNAKTLMYLKKETGLGLSEIKSKLNTGDYIFLYDLNNDRGLHKINTVKKELVSQGLTIKLFEDDKEEESYLFDNLEELHKQTAQEVGLDEEDLELLG